MERKLFLILGCNGKIDGEFVSCSKVENSILEIKPNLENIVNMIAYFKALGLFERQVKDYNSARRIIFNIQDKYYQSYKPIWDKKYFDILEKFTINHKECGLYICIMKI